jgi:hypothetical protein
MGKIDFAHLFGPVDKTNVIQRIRGNQYELKWREQVDSIEANWQESNWRIHGRRMRISGLTSS